MLQAVSSFPQQGQLRDDGGRGRDPILGFCLGPIHTRPPTRLPMAQIET
jgi:hypothetical protein